MPNSGLKMRLQTGEREKKILLLQQICKIVSLALQKSLIHVVAFEGMEAGNALMAEYVSITIRERERERERETLTR